MAKAAVTVRVKGVKELLGNIQEVDDLKPLHPLLVEAAKIAHDTAVANAPSFSGAIRRSFETEITPLSARVSTTLEHARIMEFGRKPGGRMPPPSALRHWASAHGIANTFVLARAIARRGIKGRFFRRKARTAVRKRLPALVEEMAKKLERGWSV